MVIASFEPREESVIREVLHRHLRVPRQSGRFAADRGRSSRARRRCRASSDADLVIVNTCSVTSSADQGARQTIRRIARDNPSAERRSDRMLRDAPAATRLPSFRTSFALSQTTRRSGSSRRRPSGSGTATAPAARQSSLASRAARRSPSACRPGARSAAAIASFQRRAAPAAACPLTTSFVKSTAWRPRASRRSR